MAGLLAARALSDFFETVTVVERDILPDNPVRRRGVPQGRHPHGLLARGAQVLEELFPDLLDELVLAGVPYFDGRDLSKLHYSLVGHRVVSTGSSEAFTAYVLTRPFLEYHVRRRVRDLANVEVLGGHDVVELTSTPDHGRITGVRTVNRHSREESTLAADLVVDATGRGSRMPGWLESLGYGRPVEEHVVVHLTYTSQALRMCPGALHEMALVIGVVPGRPTGMFLVGCENDTWLFTAMGMAGREPPCERTAMYEFVEEFTPPHVLAALRAAEPLGEVARHRVPSSQWRRYDKMRRFPDGLLVSGDAICSFNPIYGQGMSVAALDAVALRESLRRGVTDLPRRYFRAAAKSIGVAWQLAAGSDLAFPEVEGRRTPSMRITGRLVDWVQAACESDAEVGGKFFGVTALVDPPTRLLHPAFLYRVATVNLRRRQRDAQLRQAAVAGPADGGTSLPEMLSE